MKFSHIGIITNEAKAGAVYNEEMKISLTDFAKSKHNIEWIRPDVDSPMPIDIITKTHIAFVVDSLEEAIGDQKVILPPCDLSDELRIAFVLDDEGCPVEYMEYK